MRNFASTLVKFSKLSHIQTTILRPPGNGPFSDSEWSVDEAVSLYSPWSSIVLEPYFVIAIIRETSFTTSEMLR